MRIGLVALAAALSAALSGCAKTAHVAFQTDGSGRLASVHLARSTGNAALDQQALAAGRKHFPRAVPQPEKNRKYLLPVRIHPPEAKKK